MSAFCGRVARFGCDLGRVGIREALRRTHRTRSRDRARRSLATSSGSSECDRRRARNPVSVQEPSAAGSQRRDGKTLSHHPPIPFPTTGANRLEQDRDSRAEGAERSARADLRIRVQRHRDLGRSAGGEDGTAGAIGNEQPIVTTSEQWFSPDLGILVLTKHNDPRLGETIYRLANVSRNEPDRSLFQVPSDYTVKEPVTRRPQQQ